MSLSGKSLFITGASRGIGLAIALRVARDGANIAIAAKTEKPHPKLPGTIYTAADEVERAGGKALPLVLDVCDEAMAKAALAQAANRFGGMTFTREGEANPKSGMSQTVILRRNIPQDGMSALGQKRTFRNVAPMSALPPKADMDQSGCDVRFVPIADIGGYSIISSASDGASLGVASIGPSKSDLRLSPLYDSNSK